MQLQPSHDTTPEMALRRHLRARGLSGYRLHRRPIPGLRRTADLVFLRLRVAVFVQGCWWHGCPEHWAAPTANRDWWTQKVDLNRARDEDTYAALLEAGWAVLRVWEHESPASAAERVGAILSAREGNTDAGP